MSDGDSLLKCANGNISLTAWIKTNSSKEQTIWSKLQPTNPWTGTTIKLESGTARVWHGGGWVDSNISYNDGQWHHFAYTRDAATNAGKFYKDGVLVSTITYSSYNSTTSNAMIADDSDVLTSNRYWLGSLTDIRVYNSALNLSQIQTISSSIEPGPTPTPTPTISETQTPTPTPTITITPSTTSPDPSIISAAFSSSYGIVGVWANKYKMENYSGPLWKIRRSSDNTEQDCYSISDVTTFVGAGTAFVRTWYDQSANANHFTETDTTKQPTLITTDTVLSGATVEFGPGKGMVGAYTDSGNSDSTYAVTYYRYYSGNRVLAGSNNWLVGPYSDKNNLFAGAFANGPSLSTNVANVNTAWRSASGNFYLRVDKTDVGGAAGTTNPGTINLGVRGAFGEPAGSRVQGIIFSKPTSTNTTLLVEPIENKLYVDIVPAPSPTPTPTITVSPSITPTNTATPTVTPTYTPNPAGSNSINLLCNTADSCAADSATMVATPVLDNGNGTIQYTLSFDNTNNIRLILALPGGGANIYTTTPQTVNLTKHAQYGLGMQRYCLNSGGWVGMTNYDTKFYAYV